MAQLIMRISGEQPQLHYASIRMHANLFFVTLLEGVIIYDHIYLRQLLLQTATGAIFMTQLRLNRVITYEKKQAGQAIYSSMLPSSGTRGLFI